jgi:hypothetical protein
MLRRRRPAGPSSRDTDTLTEATEPRRAAGVGPGFRRRPFAAAAAVRHRGGESDSNLNPARPGPGRPWAPSRTRDHDHDGHSVNPWPGIMMASHDSSDDPVGLNDHES